MDTQLFSESQFEQMADDVRRVLVEVGYAVGHEGLRAMALADGCGESVDGRIVFDGAQVDDVRARLEEQYPSDAAEDLLENSLEVIASIVHRLDRCRIAVGFATNAQIFGRKPRMIPISRSPGHLQAILETLARVARSAEPEPVTALLSRAYKLSWGASCLYFAHQLSEQLRYTGAFMLNRKIPVRFILAQEPNTSEAPEHWPHQLLHLSDLLARGNRP